MKLKNKIAAISALIIFQTFGSANAAAIDKEISVLAAEQDKNNEQVETFDPDSLEKNKTKTKDELKAEEKRLEKEREEARKKIKEERKKSREELKGKTPISKNPAPNSRNSNNNSKSVTPQNFSPVEDTPAIKENPTIVENAVSDKPPVEVIPENPPVEEIQPVQPRSVTLPNPVVNYANFNEMVQALQFTPLYIPKKSGYSIISMVAINKIAEIRYVRKWEQNVSLNVRTYHRAEGEQLKDISGVQGVKWRVNTANGITIYIAKIEENKHVAAWAVGNYTFSAYVENLSFASFYSLVADELVDLSQHYYLGY